MGKNAACLNWDSNSESPAILAGSLTTEVCLIVMQATACCVDHFSCRCLSFANRQRCRDKLLFLLLDSDFVCVISSMRRWLQHILITWVLSSLSSLSNRPNTLTFLRVVPSSQAITSTSKTPWELFCLPACKCLSLSAGFFFHFH